MTDDTSLQEFLEVFETLDCWGPGSAFDTRKALSALPSPPQNILELGCGRGHATMTLAASTDATITAVDLETSALTRLTQRVAEAGYAQRVKPLQSDMSAPAVGSGSFDLLWCEASIYAIGVEQALRNWHSLLTENGCLVFSDLIWLTDTPSADIKAFWDGEYPDMSTEATRCQQIETAGYELLSTFPLSQQAWQDYAQPLQARVNTLLSHRPTSAVLQAIAHELDILNRRDGVFTYQFFVTQR